MTESDSVWRYVVYIIPLIIIVGVFLYMILLSPYLTNFNTYNTGSVVLIKRILYSPNIINYVDPYTGRVNINLIDFQKISTEHIETSLKVKDNNLAVNIELVNSETGESKRAYINEVKARTWDDYIYLGGTDVSSIKRFVKIYDNGEIYEGILKIKVFIKNV